MPDTDGLKPGGAAQDPGLVPRTPDGWVLRRMLWAGPGRGEVILRVSLFFLSGVKTAPSFNPATPQGIQFVP